MKKINLLAVTVMFLLSTIITSCAAIGVIFKAGMGFGIFIVIAVVVAIVFIVVKAGKNKS